MIALLGLGCAPSPELRYDGQVVVRVPVDDPADVEALAELGDLWSEHVVDSVDVRVDRRDLDRLPSHEVLIADLQDAVEASRPAIVRPPGFFDDWQPLDVFEDHLDELDARSPHAEVQDLGTTVEGRPLRGLRIKVPGRGDRLGILITGAQHAREWVAASSAMWIAERLVDGYGVDPEVTALLDAYRVVVVPIANPDGYEYTWTTDRMWRKNRRDNGDQTFGVDLNRNWDAVWVGPGSSTDSDSPNYRGLGPFSEPETEALSAFVIDRPMIGLHVDLHCTGQVALHPFAFTEAPAPDEAVLAAASEGAADAMRAVAGTPYDSGSFYTRLYPGNGVAIDWSYGIRGLHAWLFELRDRGQYGFLLPADQLVPTAEEAWAGVIAVAAVSERPHPSLDLAGELFPGGTAFARVHRVEEGAPIEVYASTTGLGTTVLLDGTPLALDEAALVGEGTATSHGGKVVPFEVPAGSTLWVQARTGPLRSIVASVDLP